MSTHSLSLLALLWLTVVQLASGQPVPIDQAPMYGGMDRNAVPELKGADERLISDTTKHYGSRQKASAAFIGNGFAYYQRDDLENAMRRFNQAWLLDPDNPEAYWGFASVLMDRGKHCDAMGMIDRALSLTPPTYQGFYPDAGRIVTLCAASDKTLSAEAKTQLFARSDAFYKEAENAEPNKAYLYSSWATAYYWRDQYAEAWSMVKKSQALGGHLPEKFMSMLRAKMAEPTQ